MADILDFDDLYMNRLTFAPATSRFLNHPQSSLRNGADEGNRRTLSDAP